MTLALMRSQISFVAAAMRTRALEAGKDVLERGDFKTMKWKRSAKVVAIDVAFGGKADMAFCTANVR